ncbi:LamG-like jellyroll fold domain-containing protein [Sphingobium sp. YR768]|uniref:LamG-like jellyroll fold domain-containing protein n=1 Tax=Sphingobium sp. YR768 TaxID=1884365 RepID=UPI0015A53841|nr:LamG-like jellyroll fold domain-containing protein [Sphingobium sp. YR768]
MAIALSCATNGSAFAQTSVNTQAAIDWRFEGADKERPQFHTQFAQPDFVPGVSGRAWRSDGFSSWVSAPLSLDANRGFSVEVWLALESYPSGYEAPADRLIPASILQQATRDAGFDIFIDAFGRWGFRVSTSGGAIRVQAKEPFPLNKWVHVAATYDPYSGEARLYLNGQLLAAKKTRPAMFRPAMSALEIANSWQRAPLGAFNINGLNAAYDNVKVMGGVLSPETIAANANSNTPPPAARSLVVPETRFAQDLQRPRYHALPPANWTNEPHGLIRRGATWHMFYQRTPNGPYKTLMTWGHMKSEDLVHWTDLPIALRPELQTDDFGFDMKGIWSGDVVTGPGGFAFAFYTSVNHSATFYNPGISMAISDDPDLINWKKAGPLIDRTGVRDFRDPYVWFEGGEAHMIVGAALGSSGGLAYYRCANLASRSCWKRQPPMAPFNEMDVGSEIWEMPVFEKIADGKYVLVANPIGGKVSKYGEPTTRGVYWIGDWDGATFKPDSLEPKMLDVLPGHLSPTVARDAGGELVGIGIVDERRTATAQLRAGWAHSFSLPRVWRLLPDGKTLGQSPLRSLEQLRNGSPLDITLAGSGERQAGDLGRMTEIKALFSSLPTQGTYGVTLAVSPDGREATRLYYDVERREFVLDKTHSTAGTDDEGPHILRGAYDEAAFGKPRDFHVYVDHSVVDVFINDAAAFSFRIYPAGVNSTGFGILSTSHTEAQVQAWRLNAAPVTLDQAEPR